jgi:integrase/recombinase XerD
VARPVVDADYTATIGLDAPRPVPWSRPPTPIPARKRCAPAAVIRLLLHNALRVNEACAADVTDLGTDAGHRVLRVTRKGARKARVPLTPATAAALDAYLAARARQAGIEDVRTLAGPLLATVTGRRLQRGDLWELGRRLACTVGIETWDQLSPHCLRHSAITFALDAGTALRNCRTTPGTKTPAPPAATTAPATASTATARTPSPPTSPNHARRGCWPGLPARACGAAGGGWLAGSG